MSNHRLIHSFILSLLLISQIIAPLRAQSNASDKIAVVRARGATMLDSTGQAKGVKISAGSLVIVKGRNADSSQIFVIGDDGQSGWVAANALLLVNIASLPVMEQEASPTAVNEVTESTNLPNAEKLDPTNLLTGTNLLSETTTISVTRAPTPARTAADLGGSITAKIKSTTQLLNLRKGPGVNYPVVRTAEAGSEWIAVGRDTQSNWVQITALGTGDLLWASAAFLTLSAPIAQLAVSDNLPPSPSTSTPEISASVLATNTQPSAVPEIPQQVASVIAQNNGGLSGTLVFQDRIGGTIYGYHLETGALRALSGGIDPAISPDGKLVAFTRDGGDSGLYVINIDGSGERRLYNDRELLRSPKWSPDGGKIVFSRSNGFVDCRILQGKVCMGDDAIFDLLPEDLQNDAITNNAVKALPNSRQYFFTLSRVRLDNGEFRDIASKGAAGAPDWTYGGIVYQSDNGLQRTSDDSSKDSTLIAQDIQVGNYIDPDQQPNGGRIVFQHSRGGHWQIYGVNPDGSGMAALTTLATVMVDALPSSVSPAWSPDGQQIVYLSNRNSYESVGPWHLWVMNADGSNQRRLPIEVEFNYSFGAEQMVSWGP